MKPLGQITPERRAIAAPKPMDPLETLERRINATVDEDASYDILSDGLRKGRFGGLPNQTPAATALVEVLRLRAWPVNFRAFADAMPHYANNFGVEEARCSLRILGLSLERDKVLGRNLAGLPLGSFVITKDERCLFLRLNSEGQPALFDPHSETFQRLWRGHTYDCLVVEPVDDEMGQRAGRVSWIGRTMARFGPENRMILILTFLSNALIILASLSVGFIFDKVLPAKAFDTLICLLIGVALLLYIDLKLRDVKSRVIARVSGRLEYIVSSSLYEKLISFRLEMLTAASVSEQINRLKQFEMVRDFFCGPVVAVLFELPFVLLLLTVIFWASPAVAILLIGVTALYFLIGLTLYPKITRASKEMAGLRAECLRLQEETISQREQIIQRGLGPMWSGRLGPNLRKLSLARYKLEGVWRLLNSLISVVTPLAIGGVIILGSTQVMAGNMSGGALIVCMILASRLLSPVQQALLLAVRAPDMLNLFRQMDAMMQIPDGQPKTPLATATPLHRNTSPPEIVIDGLVLRYPKAVTPALKSLTLQFEAGTFTCITGPSGAGKSSLLNAVMGHYRPQSGTVLIGPSNIEQFDSRQKTDMIGYMGHRPLQIHGTLAQNLRLTKPEATDEDLAQVCEEVGLTKMIDLLPNGFETRLDHKFRFRFSPSFRTKFAVAQLLLKSPKVLLLDEPETGLSDEDEQRLMSVIKSRAGRMTCLMVTHRPSLVRQADRALVLRAGQVQFYGPPSDLYARRP